MTLDEAIKLYTSNAEHERIHGSLQGCLDFKQLAKWLTELKQLREQTRWILCSERMPKIADVYRVTRYCPNNVMNPKYFVDACFFDGSNTWYNDNRINHERNYADNVIAWQENPEPYKVESEEAQLKQIDDSCLDFDFDKVKETLKKDGLDNLIVDHSCEEKQDQTRDEKMIDAIDFAIKVTDTQDDYSMGMRNGMRYVKSLIDGKEPQYELRRTDEEIKLGLALGDEVIGDYGAKGVVVGIDTYKDEVWLSLLMRNHKVPQLVKASMYTKTGRHFDTIEKLYEEMKK